MEKALAYARDNAPRFVDELKEFLRIPSISTDPTYRTEVGRCAEWLANNFRQIGMQRVELMPTAGHPIVFAEHLSDPSLPTVLVYGHYDVQPPDPVRLWETPPFEPTIRGDSLFARGASDDKGQAYMHVKAAEAYLQTSERLPVNLKFIVEGEEECGSNNLASFIQSNRDLVSADVVLISDTALFDGDTPSITYGLRGIAYVEVELRGPDRDLHSGVYGGAIENPINALASLIAGLHDMEHRITVAGFYDDVRDLAPDERTAFASLPFDEKAWMRSVDVEAVKVEKGYSILEATTARPTLDVNGIWGGYTAEGSKTVLPSTASAKISMRLVPDQRPKDIARKIRQYFEDNTPPTMNLTFKELHGGDAVVVDKEHPAMQAAFLAMRQVFQKEPVFTREGGTIPVVADFKRLLGLETILMGFGLSSDAIHSPNERFGLDRFKKGIETSVRFMNIFGTDLGH